MDRLNKQDEEVSHLPPEEAEVQALFATLDEDASESLSMDELDGLNAISGTELTDDEIELVKSEADTNMDGVIIWEENFP